MIVGNIHYSSRFIKKLKKLPQHILKQAILKERIFRTDPLHPSLRLHELKGVFKGSWSISISMNYRIIFKRQKNADILFVSIGTHDIYKNL
mgnify:CR=1 FL=1|jgi:addiction module RelE/StbE family toxin